MSKLYGYVDRGMVLGLAIYQMRKTSRVSIQTLSKEVGRRTGSLYDYETGKVSPTVTVLFDMIRVMGFMLSDLQGCIEDIHSFMRAVDIVIEDGYTDRKPLDYLAFRSAYAKYMQSMKRPTPVFMVTPV